jgi:hypothetical protein
MIYLHVVKAGEFWALEMLCFTVEKGVGGLLDFKIGINSLVD